MRTALVLAGILVLLASAADARSSGQSTIDIVGSDTEVLEITSACKDLKLDIIGSLAEDIDIIAPNLSPKDIEIVGSRTKNIKISSKKSLVPVPGPTPYPAPCPTVVNNYYTVCEKKTPAYCPPKPCPKPSYPNTGGAHLGVDAWHGQYWYSSKAYTPKWPQIADFSD